MRRRDPGSLDEDTAQAPMLGVLSVLLLLIPSLLLLAQVTRYAEITITTPRFGGDGPAPHVISCGRDVQLHVAIATDGFYARQSGEPWARVGRTILQYDHQALHEVVRAHKRAFPQQTVAVVSAEASVSYETLVSTLDTVRGPGCQLAPAYAGEEVPEACMLWHPIIESRTPDHDVPAFRGGSTWPPRPPQHLSPGSTPT